MTMAIQTLPQSEALGLERQLTMLEHLCVEVLNGYNGGLTQQLRARSTEVLAMAPPDEGAGLRHLLVDPNATSTELAARALSLVLRLRQRG